MSFDPGSARLTQTVRPSSWGRNLEVSRAQDDVGQLAHSLCMVNGAEKLEPVTRGTLYLRVVTFLTYNSVSTHLPVSRETTYQCPVVVWVVVARRCRD